MINPKHLETFTAACIQALYFTETGDEGQPPADAKLDPDCEAQLASDCRQFWDTAGACILDEDSEEASVVQAGHDFWFTRNGHGAGFWDGDWPKHGQYLTHAAQEFPEFEPVWADGE